MHSILNLLHIAPSFFILGLLSVLCVRFLWRRYVNNGLNYEVEAFSLTSSLVLSAIGIIAGSFVHHSHESSLSLLDPCFVYAIASVVVAVAYRKVLARKNA
ncbi:hypothetical protein [Candidatus Fokinia solitaria]|uniref:hypothetical protein n=1 Tax=Candidatus Fokinia solitaria TaxID=1802984 RepID=UPI0011AB6B66|nr:hypothetical protein [Candidatus Fokinia solitaria]